MGKLMRVLMPRVAGRADGSRVKERVTAFFA
nr:GatB/YqeY domain-containing protein [uncultured Fretibacterium sp.]